MAISVVCPSCARPYTVKEEAAGKRFKCKDCGAVVEVPGAETEFGNLSEEDYGDPDASDLSGEAPPAPAVRGGARSNAATAAAERTKLPAIFMYVVCGLSMLNSIWGIVSNAAGLQGPMPPGADPQMQQFLQGLQGLTYVIGVFYLLRDVFLIYAFSRMQMLQSYGIALTGAILSVIPCVGSPCCALGIPFGIWALVVLNDPAVKAAFR